MLESARSAGELQGNGETTHKQAPASTELRQEPQQEQPQQPQQPPHNFQDSASSVPTSDVAGIIAGECTSTLNLRWQAYRIAAEHDCLLPFGPSAVLLRRRPLLSTSVVY